MTTKENVHLMCWDECDGEARLEFQDKNENELIIPITCTDDELVAFLRKHNGDEKTDGEYNWRCAGVARGENTATVEWRSDRNHFAVTTVMWWI